MNAISYSIQTPSFKGQREFSSYNKPYGKTYSKSLEQDSVEFQKRTARQERLKQRDKKNQIKGFLMGLAAAGVVVCGGNKVVDNLNGPDTNFNAYGKTVEEAAEFCDVDERAIMLVNNIDDSDQTVDEIIVPEKYDAVDDELAEVYVVDGDKYAYIIPNEYNVTAEELKEAFGIEDGVLKEYNDLGYDWGSNEYGSYKDYTDSYIPYEGVKVPLKELN